MSELEKFIMKFSIVMLMTLIIGLLLKISSEEVRMFLILINGYIDCFVMNFEKFIS